MSFRRVLFTSPHRRADARRLASYEGEVGREAVGRGVSFGRKTCGLPPSLTLPLKGGGNAHAFAEVCQ